MNHIRLAACFVAVLTTVCVAEVSSFAQTVTGPQTVPGQIVPLNPQNVTPKTLPVFKDGQAQIVKGFSSSREWIRHDLFVETDFDSDGNGLMDRMHVSVCRPKQTDTEGLKVPVIYGTSPYYNGTSPAGREYVWDPKQEVGGEPPKRKIPEGFKARIKRPNISTAYVRQWVKRGFAVVHSSSPGTGLSQGCPTVGAENESLAPKAVIDWLCGRRKGYTELNSNIEVKATWCTGKVGMTGTSYNGTLPIAAATTGVEGLEAVSYTHLTLPTTPYV